MSYVVDFRGRPACPCLAAWLPVFEAELIRRGVIRFSIDIAQLIGGAEESGGTHTDGGAADIWQHDDVTVWVARQMGADASWARTTGSFATNRHTHIVLTGCPHNGPARYQIDEVRAGGDGLLGSAPDPGPRPLSGRTWREGIAWAKQLQEPTEEELLMAAQDDIIDAVRANTDRVIERIGGLEQRDRERSIRQQEETRNRLQELVDLAGDDGVSDDQLRARIRRLRERANDALDALDEAGA